MTSATAALQQQDTVFWADLFIFFFKQGSKFHLIQLTLGDPTDQKIFFCYTKRILCGI